jgi:membrane protein CcdC involved in cytochrome C biogenesis
MHGAAPLLSSVVAILIVLGVMALRLRRMSRARPLKVERLWIAPALLLAVAALVLVEVPPHAADWLWIALAALAGAALGWLRGSLMRITVHPETHAVEVKASPAAILLIVAMLVVRQLVRLSQAEGGAAARYSSVSGALIDALIVFAVALAAVQRLEMGLRATRLIAAAKAVPPDAA